MVRAYLLIDKTTYSCFVRPLPNIGKPFQAIYDTRCNAILLTVTVQT